LNIQRVYELLTDIGISTIATETSLEPDVEQGENVYKLREQNGIWEFLHVQYEKQDGKEEIKTTFNKESTATRFYFFFQLSSYFFNTYTYLFERKEKELNIGEPNFTIENLKEAFHRLNIPSRYYSLDGTIKNHCFILDKVNEKESREKFVNINGVILDETMVLENWLTYSFMYQDVYKLYLLDQYYEKLIENGEIQHELTDEDYKMYLSPASYYIINQ